MNEWKRYHPIVNFSYFLAAISFSCLLLHPITLAISTLAGFVSFVSLKGKKAIGKKIAALIVAFLLMSFINPAFNHEGVTILAYFPSGNPFTLESLCYGFLSAAMMISVLLLFSCFHEVMTSDKLMYLFGKIFPSLSLVFSMTLRFVPRFIHQLKETAVSQKCVGRDVTKGNILQRAKGGLSVFSILVTQSLENAIDTSDSMKSRGYGLPGRSAFSLYRFGKRDGVTLGAILVFSAYVLLGKIMGAIHFSCFPAIQISAWSPYGISVFAAYGILLFLPLFIELSEVRKWNSIKSKI